MNLIGEYFRFMYGNFPMKPAPVAYPCNPHYSGGRDQEYHGSKSACANSSQDPISKYSTTK
jgi:hypothetical protein